MSSVHYQGRTPLNAMYSVSSPHSSWWKCRWFQACAGSGNRPLCSHLIMALLQSHSGVSPHARGSWRPGEDCRILKHFSCPLLWSLALHIPAISDPESLSPQLGSSLLPQRGHSYPSGTRTPTSEVPWHSCLTQMERDDLALSPTGALGQEEEAQ